jgi:dTDP-4-dehydrorhamnose reductase
VSASNLRILLLGKKGQVGWELQRSLAPLGQVIALDRAGMTPQQARTQGIANIEHQLCGNLADLDGLDRTVHILRPNIIVNAAAYTAVDKAETDGDLARLINVEAPAVLAKAAEKEGALLVHYSTDYVFDGSSETSWLETDSTNPLNVYGLTKLEGEQRILQACQQHLIFRTSWVYSAQGVNFAKTILKLAQERDSLKVINDQIGAPTGSDLLADVTAYAIRVALQRPSVSGLYHLAAGGQTSWYGYASYVIEFARQAGIEIKVALEKILPVPASEFHLSAQRPKNSLMDTRKLQNTFEVHLPHWQHGVNRMLSEILEHQS